MNVSEKLVAGLGPRAPFFPRWEVLVDSVKPAVLPQSNTVLTPFVYGLLR